MATVSWSEVVRGTPREVLAYLADYSNAEDWQSGVVQATRLMGLPGHPDSGEEVETLWRVRIAAARTERQVVTWTVLARDASSLSLRGRCAVPFWFWPGAVEFELMDTYYVIPADAPHTALVQYVGRMQGKGMGRLLTRLVAPGWARLKKESGDRLVHARRG